MNLNRFVRSTKRSISNQYQLSLYKIKQQTPSLQQFRLISIPITPYSTPHQPHHHSPFQHFQSRQFTSSIPKNQQKEQQKQKVRIIYDSYVPVAGEEYSYARTFRNLPDEYITPLAETPSESYTIINDLAQHPIRYRSWNSVLNPNHRPSSHFTNHNDYIPQKQSFQAQQVTETDVNHWADIYEGFMNEGFRGLSHALRRAPAEYIAGVGLLFSLMIVYATDPDFGTISGFNYDEWVDEKFRQLLIYCDEIFQIGKKIEQMEKKWDEFEQEQIIKADLPSSQHNFTTRFYLWSRDVLFSDTRRELSRYKARKYATDSGTNPDSQVPFPKIDQSTQELHTAIQKNPNIKYELSREELRDQELVRIDQLRIRMIRENNGMPLTNNQQYILRNEMRSVVREFIDLDDDLGIDEPHMDEIFYDEYLIKQKHITRQQQHIQQRDGLYYPTTGLPKPKPLQDVEEHINTVTSNQQLRDLQLQLLGQTAQEKHYEQLTGQKAPVQRQQSSSPSSSSTTRFDPRQYNVHNNNNNNTNDNDKPQPPQGIFGRMSSWWSSNTEPIQNKNNHHQNNKKSDIGLDWDDDPRLQFNGDPAHDEYIIHQREALARAELLHDENEMNNNNNNHKNNTKNRQEMANALKEEYVRELYGDHVPSRHALDQQTKLAKESGTWNPFNFKSEEQIRLEAERDAKRTPEQREIVKIIDNPFTWLDKREKNEKLIAIETHVDTALKYRDAREKEYEKSMLIQNTNSTYHKSNNNTISTLNPKEFITNQEVLYNPTINTKEDDEHASRLKGGLFGNWFGGSKK